MRILIPVFLLFFTFISCSKKSTCTSETPDFVIFGHFYGECGGDKCIETYKLTPTSLLEDTLDVYAYPGFNEGSFDVNRDDKLDQVKDLLTRVPDVLLDQDSTYLGQPDAGDWGGIYFEYKKDNFHKKWYIDMQDGNLAAKYRPFRDLIIEKIDLLQ